MHVNARHHSVALVAAPVRSMHHLLVEYYQLDDVGQGYDLPQSTPEQIVATLGRRPNDLMTSYYMRTPSDIYAERGWGGREVDDVTPPVAMTNLGSFWGHKGLFEDIGAPTPHAETRCAPVQVMEGNYERMAGKVRGGMRCAARPANRFGNLPIMCLPGGQAETDREPLRVNDDVDFGRSPPRDRPRQWSASPFLSSRPAGGRERGAVDHLNVAIVSSGNGVHQLVPHTGLPPSHEAVVAGGARATMF
jgi:hypothetical protein